MNDYKIIIVGENNICNSFMCEVVLKGLLRDRKKEEIRVVSRGLVVLFTEPVDPLAASALTEAGYVIDDFRSAQLTGQDLEDARLVLTLTESQADHCRQDYACSIPCLSLSAFLGKEADIPVLAGADPEDYRNTLTLIEGLMEAVADKVTGEEMGC